MSKSWTTKKRAYFRSARGRYNGAKRTAKQGKKLFLLTESEYTSIVNLPCHYCEGYFKRSVYGIGLDRISNEKYYEAGNVLPCCTFCNKLRSNLLTVDETKIVIKALISYKIGLERQA